MLYCAKCNRNVDFNSVGVTKTTSPRGAMTMMGEDFSPTVISGGSSSTEIVNVCKECGNKDYLWPTPDHYLAFLEKRAQEKKQKLKNKKTLNSIFINLLRFGTLIFLPIILAKTFKPPREVPQTINDAITRVAYAEFGEGNWEAVQAATQAIEAERYNYFNWPVSVGTFIACLFAIWVSYRCPKIRLPGGKKITPRKATLAP
jgi:hypothetical protein